MGQQHSIAPAEWRQKGRPKIQKCSSFPNWKWREGLKIRQCLQNPKCNVINMFSMIQVHQPVDIIQRKISAICWQSCSGSYLLCRCLRGRPARSDLRKISVFGLKHYINSPGPMNTSSISKVSTSLKLLAASTTMRRKWHSDIHQVMNCCLSMLCTSFHHIYP